MKSNLTNPDNNIIRPYVEIKDGVLTKYLLSDEENGIVRIPDGVEVIAKNVFGWNGLPEGQALKSETERKQNVREIYIPASVKKIEGGAFLNTRRVKKIEISPDSQAGVVIDGVLFNKDKTVLIYCMDAHPDKSDIDEKEEHIYYVPEGVRTIDHGAFRCCYLDKVVLPDTIESIKDGAFAYSGVRKINIPHSVTEFGENVFKGCYFKGADAITVDNNCKVLTVNSLGLFRENGEKLLDFEQD